MADARLDAGTIRSYTGGCDRASALHAVPQRVGTDELDVFFTHGFNVNAGDARAWGAEVFKRLLQSGSVGGKIVLGRNRDFDLNSDNYRNGWGRPAVDDKTDWHHSDMKDMAYFYVYKLYEQLIQKGDLK